MTHDPSSRPATHGVTLLPRHWAWLAAQSRSPSATLRRLVEEARRDPDGHHRRPDARDHRYRYLRGEAGDRPGFEDAVRALYADDPAEFEARTRAWPEDVRTEARRLAAEAWSAGDAP